MISVQQLQNYALYLYFFFVNFQELSFFGLNNFSIPKFTVLVYIGTIAIQYKDYTKRRDLKKIMLPLLVFFGLLTIVSLFNINDLSARFFDFAIFQNILLFWILINHGRKDIKSVEKGMFTLALGSTVLAIFYNLGVGVSLDKGRVILFGDNSNITSIRMVISSLIIITMIMQNRLRMGRYRYLFLFPIIIMLKLMADTGSRLGFISFALAFIVLIFFYKAKNNLNKIGVIIIGVFSLAYFLRFILNSEVLMLRLLQTVADQDLAGRDEVWVEIINIVQNNLIFGIGQTGYFSIFGLASPHNVFIEVLIYTGIVGLFLYLVFILRISIYAYKCIKIKGKILPLLLMSPIFGILLSGQILNMKLGWLVLAYIISVHLNEFSLSLPQEKKGV
jgi:O-antigen ligase